MADIKWTSDGYPVRQIDNDPPVTITSFNDMRLEGDIIYCSTNGGSVKPDEHFLVTDRLFISGVQINGSPETKMSALRQFLRSFFDEAPGGGVDSVFGRTGSVTAQSGDYTAAQVTGATTGAATSTDNAVARFDGTTGKVIQNSVFIVDDNGNCTIPNSATNGITLYNTSDQVTNYERLRMYWSGNSINIQSDKGGSGIMRPLILGNSFGIGLTIQGASSLTGGISIASNYSSSNISDFGISGSYTNTSGINNHIALLKTINQSSTAGYKAYYASIYEQGLGSGEKKLIDVGTNSAANGAGTHTSRFSVDNLGNTIAAKYQVSALNTAPSSASDTGTAGEIRYTSDYIYVCVATNTWKRSPLTTW